jgi:hypothetical protein
MHLPHSIAIWPNLELKTRPKQLLGSLPLDIVLPGLSVIYFWNVQKYCFYPIFPTMSDEVKKVGGNQPI